MGCSCGGDSAAGVRMTTAGAGVRCLEAAARGCFEEEREGGGVCVCFAVRLGADGARGARSSIVRGAALSFFLSTHIKYPQPQRATAPRTEPTTTPISASVGRPLGGGGLGAGGDSGVERDTKSVPGAQERALAGGSPVAAAKAAK